MPDEPCLPAGVEIRDDLRDAAATPRGDLVVVPADDHFQAFASAAFADAVAEFLPHD